MKRVLLSITLLLSTLVLGGVSCDNELDINRDPDSLSQSGVALSTEFPTAIAGIVGAQGAYGALVGGFWAQYWTQVMLLTSTNLWMTTSTLGTSGIVEGLWRNMFDALGDARNVKQNALEQERTGTIIWLLPLLRFMLLSLWLTSMEPFLILKPIIRNTSAKLSDEWRRSI